MTLKSIVCLFGGTEAEVPAVRAALAIAAASAARVRVVHVSIPPQVALDYFGGAMTPPGETWWQHVERYNAERLDRAHSLTARLCEDGGVGIDETAPSAHHASARFEALEWTGEPALVAEIGLSDLIVTGQPAGEAYVAGDSVLGVALFATGRPVLMVPAEDESEAPAWRNRAAAIAWNGSGEAMRAVVNAAPILDRSEAVHVVRIAASGAFGDERSDEALLDYLAARGLRTDFVIVRADREAPSQLFLAKAREVGADYAVMGAYGHGVFREMLLGGFTKEVLATSRLPLLINH